MLRVAVFVGALILVPSFAAAQRPCTTDARLVVDEIYRHVLERAPDAGSAASVDRLNSGTTVREVVVDRCRPSTSSASTEARESVIRTIPPSPQS